MESSRRYEEYAAWDKGFENAGGNHFQFHVNGLFIFYQAKLISIFFEINFKNIKLEYNYFHLPRNK